MKRIGIFSLLVAVWSAPAAGQPVDERQPIDEPGRNKAAETPPTPAPAPQTPAGIIESVAQQCQPGIPCKLWPHIVRLAMDPVSGPACLAQIRRLGDPRGAELAAQATVYGATDDHRLAGQQALTALATRPSSRIAVSHIAFKSADKALRDAAREALGPFVKPPPSEANAAPKPTVAREASPEKKTGPQTDLTRLVYGQTAITRKEGSVSWNVFNLGWHTFDYGVTDYFQIGIGTLVPVGVFAIMPSVKLGTEVGSGVYLGLQAQGGLLYPYIENETHIRFGVYGGGPVLTVVSGRLTFNLSVPVYGVTVAVEEDQWGAPSATGVYSGERTQETEYHNLWLVAPNIGFDLNVSRRVSLNLEIYVPLSESFEVNGKIWLLLYGLRISGEQLHADISFVVPIFPDVDEILQYAPLGFPLLSLGYRW